MSYLVISDLHLKNNDPQEKINYLENLFLKFDRLIIVGDLYEGYFWSFKDLIKSKFKKLIQIIKNKKSVYIIGNHDESVINELDLAKKFFSIVDFEYRLKIKNKEFLFIHSHKIYPSIDEKLKLKYLPKKITNFLIKIIGYYKDHRLRALKYLKNKITIEDDTKKLLNVIDKKFQKRSFWLITGHTHNPVVLKEERYANCGFVDFGFASYLTINDFGNIKLHIESY